MDGCVYMVIMDMEIITKKITLFIIEGEKKEKNRITWFELFTR